MQLEQALRLARPTTIVLAGLLFGDLFLDWRNTSVVTGPISVDTGASGWGGWGSWPACS